MSVTAVKLDAQYTGMWVNFFTAAGIPSDVSATYALTFTENRIQNDMLLDLNKEYLRDMGITRMGDVIAILRHAKQVHESTARDRVLSSAVPRVPVAAVTGRATAPAPLAHPSPSSPASRILEHYTRKVPPAACPAPAPHLKRRAADLLSDVDTNVKKARLIRFASASAQPTVKEGPPKTVFARLGQTEQSQTSTKSSEKPIYLRLGSKAQDILDSQVIPLQKDALKYKGILKSPSPVKKIVTITTLKNNVRKIAMGCTMRADETPLSVKEKLALPKSKSVKFSSHVQYKEIEANYKRMLKPVMKTVDNPVQNSIQGVAQKPDQKFKQIDQSVQKLAQSERLFKKFDGNDRSVQKLSHNDRVVQKFTSVFNKPERRLSMPEGVSLNSVKSRLGNKSNANNLTITTNVFKRLGV